VADETPYAKLKSWQQAMAPSERLVLYNLRPYRDESYPSPNLWGLGEGGQVILWQAALADQKACWGETKAFRDMVLNHLAGDNGWTPEGGGIAFLSESTFSVAGDVADVYEVGRALSAIQQVSAFGHVASAAYMAGENRTVVTVEGLVLDEGLHEVWFGLSVKCAPKQDDPTGADIALAEFYDYFDY